MKFSTILICICSVSAIGLNIEGSRCISQINSLVENDISSSASSNNDAGTDSLDDDNNQLFSNRGGSGSEDNSTILTQEEEEEEQKALRESFELRRYCFVVTNLYVYSLFGVTIGVIILAFWYMKYKKIWTRKTNSLDK